MVHLPLGARRFDHFFFIGAPGIGVAKDFTYTARMTIVGKPSPNGMRYYILTSYASAAFLFKWSHERGHFEVRSDYVKRPVCNLLQGDSELGDGGSSISTAMVPSVSTHVGLEKFVVNMNPGTTRTVSVVAQFSNPIGSTNATYSVGKPSNVSTIGFALLGLVKFSAGSQFHIKPQAS